MRTRMILALVLPFALALACGGGTAESGAQASLPEVDIDGAEAQRLVAEGAFLLDVTPSPRNENSGIDGSTNIPLPELESRMSEVPREVPVIVYCYGGRGSPRATQMLRDAGYTDVRLLGAMPNWETAASASGETCAGHSLGDACITDENFAACQEAEQQCPGEVLSMESCPLQFACPSE